MCHFQLRQPWAGEVKEASEVYSNPRHHSTTLQQSRKTNEFLISRQITPAMHMQKPKLRILIWSVRDNTQLVPSCKVSRYGQKKTVQKRESDRPDSFPGNRLEMNPFECISDLRRSSARCAFHQDPLVFPFRIYNRDQATNILATSVTSYASPSKQFKLSDLS